MQRCVLIVEDDPGAAELLELLFSYDGYTVEIVRDGLSAMERLDRPTVDLVVLDVMMPNRDGIAVLRELRRRPEWAETPVIISTARASDEDVWDGWRAGADYYLVKPFEPEDLRSVARSLVEAGHVPA